MWVFQKGVGDVSTCLVADCHTVLKRATGIPSLPFSLHQPYRMGLLSVKLDIEVGGGEEEEKEREPTATEDRTHTEKEGYLHTTKSSRHCTSLA